MKYLIILILTALLAGCASKYEGHTPAIVVTSVEYDGKPQMLGCKGDFKCDLETLECVYFYHKKAQNHIDQVKNLVQLGKEDNPIITELYNALCNLREASIYISILKNNNKQDWLILEKTGFVKQVSMISSILIIKIRQLENIQYYH